MHSEFGSKKHFKYFSFYCLGEYNIGVEGPCSGGKYLSNNGSILENICVKVNKRKKNFNWFFSYNLTQKLTLT